MNTYILSSNFIKNKPGHYKHIYFNIKLYENKSGHYCNLGDDWSHWTVTGFPYIPFVSLVNSVKVVIIYSLTTVIKYYPKSHQCEND
jgi:hypothetical protein